LWWESEGRENREEGGRLMNEEGTRGEGNKSRGIGRGGEAVHSERRKGEGEGKGGWGKSEKYIKNLSSLQIPPPWIQRGGPFFVVVPWGEEWVKWKKIREGPYRRRHLRQRRISKRLRPLFGR